VFGRVLEINVREVIRQKVLHTDAQFIYVSVKLGLSPEGKITE
jgi:hypothetical protein